MKKLSALLMLLSLTVFTVGCEEEGAAPVADPAADPAADPVDPAADPAADPVDPAADPVDVE